MPPGYQVFRRDRGSRGGGVAVIVKDSVDACLADQIADHESIFLKISLDHVTFFLCALYRTPNADDMFLMKLYDRLLSLCGKHVLLTGDFNLPSIVWDNLSYGCSPSGDSILDIMFLLNLKQAVDVCTRGGSILDLLFLSEIFSDGHVAIEPGISDHKLIFFTWNKALHHAKNTQPATLIKEFTRANDVAIIDYLETHIGSLLHNVETSWQSFVRTIRHCVENFVPCRKTYKHRANPWISREIIHMKRKIKRLRKKHVPMTPQLKVLKDKLQTSLAQARNTFYSNTLTEFLQNSPQKFWRYLSESKTGSSKMKVNGVIITDAPTIAEHFNAYFQSVFSQTDDYELENSFVDSDNDLLVTQEGVLHMLLQLDPKKPPGPDGIPNAFFNRYAEYLSEFLTGLFNLSIATGEIPADWGIARVKPIHKKGDPLSFENYRPISITSSCCKLLEHVIANYVYEFLSEHNVLSKHQHGFRRGLSTVTQLVTTVHEFSRVLDVSGQTDVLFLDLCKAFDKVPHGKLLHKLQRIGLPTKIVLWIQAYLQDRRQYVVIGNSSSTVLRVSSGVPQGSVLGPLLFLIYVNDLASLIPENVSVRLFADDCVIFKQISSPCDHVALQDALIAIDNWCQNGGMQLNTNKTVLLRITRKLSPSQFHYTLRGTNINNVDKYKYLGVTLSSKLTWSTHITDITTSALRKLWFLKRKLASAPSRTKILAYNACVRSKLEYASIIWDPHTKKDIMNLERINRKAVRFIFGKYRRFDSPTTLMQLNDISTLEARRKFSRLSFLYNCLCGIVKIDLPDCVKPLSVRRTRHGHEHALTPIFARSNAFKYSFFPRTVDDWNCLPCDIFHSNKFLGDLERHLLS